MEFTSARIVRTSRKGLTQEQALETLYQHPEFRIGTEVLEIKKEGEGWAAKIREPKTAGEFPPSGGGDEDSSPATEEVDGGDTHEEGPPGLHDGPPGEEGKEGEDGKKSIESEVEELTSLVHQIAEALGVGGPDASMAGGDMDEPGAGPPHHPGPGRPPGSGAHPGGGAGAPPAGRPMRPGEAPPGATPLGAPAFASTKKAAKVATFQAKQITDAPIKQAHADLVKLYGPHGYKVKQMKTGKTADGQREVYALLSVR